MLSTLLCQRVWARRLADYSTILEGNQITSPYMAGYLVKKVNIMKHTELFGT